MMTDREKMINALRDMADYFRLCRKHAASKGTAARRFAIYIEAAEDAAELLKAQKVAKDTAYNPWKNFIQAVAEETPDPCKNCSNHTSNGGSGICNCTLGLPKVTV